MKKLILQVNVPMEQKTYVGNRGFTYVNDLYKLSEQQAKLYAEKTGSDYIQVNDCDYMPGFHPIWQRFKMFDFKQYDQILYLDMDVVVLNDAPNIFELYQDEEFSAVPTLEYHKQTKVIQEELRKEQKRYNSSKDYYPFCSGVCLMSRSWLDKADEIWRKHVDTYLKVSHDQGVLNACVIELGEKYNHLSYHWGQWNKSGDYFIHLGFWRKNNFDVVKFCKKYDLQY